MKKIILKNIVKTNTQSYQKSDKWNYINYLDTGNITENCINEIVKLYPHKDKIPSRAKRKIKIGDILYSTVRPNKKHYGYIEKNYNNLLVSTGFVVIEPDIAKVNGKYLYYYLTQDNITTYLQTIAENTTAAYPSISPKDIENLTVELPPLNVQNKIIKILSNYDNLIENNNRRIKILKEMAQKIYKEWFVDFKFPGHEKAVFKDSELGKIPSDWEIVIVKNLLERLKSKNKYTKDNVFSMGDIIVIDQSSEEYLGFHNNKPDFIANSQTPLIIFGDHTCKMQMLVENFSIGPNVITITSKTVPIAFLFYLIDSLIETKEYKRHWNDLIAKKVILPQNYLTLEFSKAIIPMLEMINYLKHKNMKLKQIRDLLLPRLISGEIDVENMEVL